MKNIGTPIHGSTAFIENIAENHLPNPVSIFPFRLTDCNLPEITEYYPRQ